MRQNQGDNPSDRSLEQHIRSWSKEVPSKLPCSFIHWSRALYVSSDGRNTKTPELKQSGQPASGAAENSSRSKRSSIFCRTLNKSKQASPLKHWKEWPQCNAIHEPFGRCHHIWNETTYNTPVQHPLVDYTVIILLFLLSLYYYIYKQWSENLNPRCKTSVRKQFV